MTVLEDLIAENRETFSEELMVARAQPRDEQATADLKGDPDKLAKLAELAEVDPEDIVDAAVRGTNVTFMVKDEETALSAGYFPLTALKGSATAKRKRTGTVASRTPTDQAPRGGSATVPTIVSTGGDEPAPGDDAPVPPAEGLPSDINDMGANQVASLLKDTPEGVDANAVLTHEFAREGGPRVQVQRAAKTLDMLDDDGNPKPAGVPPT